MTLPRGGAGLPGWLVAAMASVTLAALVNAYWAPAVLFIRDTWGPTLICYDNGVMTAIETHRLASPGDPGQAPAGAAWPETALRAACLGTRNLMGLSGPEGDLWIAAMEGSALVVRATWAPVEVGRYQVLEGNGSTGLAVIELQAGANGLHLLDVCQPFPDGGWFVTEVHTAIGISPPSPPGS